MRALPGGKLGPRSHLLAYHQLNGNETFRRAALAKAQQADACRFVRPLCVMSSAQSLIRPCLQLVFFGGEKLRETNSSSQVED